MANRITFTSDSARPVAVLGGSLGRSSVSAACRASTSERRLAKELRRSWREASRSVVWRWMLSMMNGRMSGCKWLIS